MPAEPTTKAPPAGRDKPAAAKFDPHRPEMPHIPGVAQSPSRSFRLLSGLNKKRLLQAGSGIAAAVLVVVIAIFWGAQYKSRMNADLAAAGSEASDSMSVPPPLPNSTEPAQEKTNVAATVEELSKPWASRKFTFVKPFTDEKIDAIVIRLPGGNLWAFSLQEPFGRCELEFVTDLGKLTSQYGYHAAHPMVGNPCNGTVYDPLKVGAIGGDTWARGEIVQGAGLRPPMSIDVKVSGHSIIADNIE